MTDAASLLSSRRSIPIPMLGAPAPSGETLDEILTIAARVPDHGKLAPWRFILVRGEAASAIGRACADLVERREGSELSAGRRRAEESRFDRSPLVVVVVSTAAEHVKIPVFEQLLSAGAVAMNLVNAAHAKGYGANWVTEWVAYDDQAKALMGIAAHETVVGFVHLGTAREHPGERPRPSLSDIVTEATAPSGDH